MKKMIHLIAVLLAVATLTLSVSAVAFTPSVEQKGAPTVSEQQTEDGKSVVAIVKDSEGKEIAGVYADQILITSVAGIQEAPEEVQADLEAACNSIAESENLETAAPALKEALEKNESALTTSDLVVRDLIHIAVDEEVNKALEDGTSITLKFDLGIKPEEFLMVMVFVDGEWIVIDAENIEILEDGLVSVTFPGAIGSVAFVVEKTLAVETANLW